MVDNHNYTPESRELSTTPFTELPLGSVTPLGWLREQLEIQARGMSGHLDETWADVGPNSGWLGGSGENWERGPYYLDGLVPLAYLLRDAKLISKIQPWMEWTLNSQTEDGMFGPLLNDDWWPRMTMLKALIQYYEASRDERVIPFITRYFRYQYKHLAAKPLTVWGRARGGENILCVQWLYRKTRDAFLLNLIDLIHAQTVDWTSFFTDFPLWRAQKQFDHRAHVVNVAMALKEPALYYLLSHDRRHRDAPLLGIRSLMRYHGQVHGMFSGDEWLAGTDPSQGLELCAVVEYMYSLEQLIQVYADGMYGDVLEEVAFNALPATISPDWHGHQYDQQVNQVACTLAKRNWTCNNDDSNLFGLAPNFGCCTANMHQGWPKYAARLWMATDDGGLAAVSYAPCRLTAQVAMGVPVTLIVDSEYPFRETIAVRVECAEPVTFPIKLRIPSWCHEARAMVSGGKYDVIPEKGYITINREWQCGDVVQLTLPMKVRLKHRANLAVSVHAGPLAYALPVKEIWSQLRGEEPYSDFEIYPGSPWNYGLLQNVAESARVTVSKMHSQPFLAEQSPVRLVVAGRRVPTWRLEENSAASPPLGPIKTDTPIEDLTLVPYGSARLRVAEFPTVE